MGRFLGIALKRLVPCRCLDGHVKESYEMSMALEADRRSNFFFSPPAHLCAVTYITEILMHVTLKLYCGYKYTKPCMINRIWDLKQL